MVLGRQTTLTVTVVEKADAKRPIAEAEVHIASPVRSERTDASGQAIFTKVPAGRLKLEVVAKDFCPEQLDAPAASPKAIVTVPLQREAVLDVHVFAALDPKTPIPGATIAIAGRKEKPVTDAKGVCQIRGLPPGPAAIEIAAAGYQALEARRSCTRGRPRWRSHCEEQPICRYRSSTTSTTGRSPPPRCSCAAGLEQRCQADGNGAYGAAGLPATEAEVAVTAPNFPPGQVSQQLNAGKNHAIVRLKPQTQLVVTVVDARTRIPVAAARIRLPGLAKTATADANGRAVFSEIPAGTLPVAATARGYCEKEVSAAAPFPKANVVVALDRGIVLVGEAVNAINKQAVPAPW